MQAHHKNSAAAISTFSSECLRWVSSNSVAFNDIHEPSKIAPGTKYKILGEIALMLTIWARCGRQASSLEYNNILSAFRAAIERIQAPSEDAYSNIRLLLSFTLALETNGLPADRFREGISRLLRQNVLCLRDQTPWGILAVTYFLDLCGLPHDHPRNNELYKWSILRSKPPLHFLSTHDKYALSHLLFFLGDFGARKEFFLRQPDYDLLSNYIDEVTASCLIDEDWDLLGEFLIGYECIGESKSQMRDYAWEQYLAHQKPGGEIEAPPRVLKKYMTSEHSMKRNFELYYHQTLIGIIASGLYLQRDG